MTIWRALAIVAFVLCSATCLAQQGSGVGAARPARSWPSCGNADFSVGPSTVGILVDETPKKRIALRFFDVSRQDGGTMVMSRAVHLPGIAPRGVAWHWSGPARFLADTMGLVTLFRSDGVIDSAAQRVERIGYWPGITWDDMAVPAIVRDDVVLAIDNGNSLVEFDATTGVTGRRRYPDVGSFAYIWSTDGILAQEVPDAVSRHWGLRVFNRQERRWVTFSPPTEPDRVRTIALRRTASGALEFILFDPGTESAQARIDVMAAGDTHSLARGRIDHVILSPSREDVYGYVDSGGAFVPVADRSRNRYVRFWLDRFSKTRSVVDFGFLDGGRVAVLKSNPDAHTPSIQILRVDDRLAVTKLYTNCGY
jgi:hypothetical protein